MFSKMSISRVAKLEYTLAIVVDVCPKPWTPDRFGQQLHGLAKKRGQPSLNGDKAENSDMSGGVEADREVDVTTLALLTTGDRAKQR